MSKKKILVIEDEDICVTLLNLVINVENFDVFVARNGEEGVQMAVREKPDLIFLDIMLPKINGFDVAKRLRENPALSASPIVVVTARAGESGQKTARQLGCQEFITKPFKVRQIKEVLNRYLKEPRGSFAA